jgi:hypothetical protein
MQQKENDRIHLLNNVIDAAKDVGVKFFLLGSVMGAGMLILLFHCS